MRCRADRMRHVIRKLKVVARKGAHKQSSLQMTQREKTIFDLGYDMALEDMENEIYG